MTKDDLLRLLAEIVKQARAGNRRTVAVDVIVDIIVSSHLEAPLSLPVEPGEEFQE